MEQPTTLQPDAEEANVSVPAPEVEEDTRPKGGIPSESMRMLENIISIHVGGNIFLLGKKEVLFTVEDVGIILGLPSFGHPIRHYGSFKKKSRLHEQFEVWFLEHTRVRQPINWKAYPRLFTWGTFVGKTSSFPIASLTGQQVIKNLTVERNECETIYKGNQTVPEDTSTVPPAAASLSLLQEIAASIKSQKVKFDQLSTHLNEAN
ncbi:hypothetical protein Taro_029741 [Colocasia esculenta]|uniref:Uncharacterized protein n=1 Tax=Colocasia esculenta TaxID=4460 RepID=A0A843VPX6_COLES|nr:hypothetical protein [Colocasia esculenta]